jgi:hypothetical protein
VGAHDVFAAMSERLGGQTTTQTSLPQCNLYAVVIQENLAHVLKTFTDVSDINTNQSVNVIEDIDAWQQSCPFSWKSSPKLWIDAICINQAGHDERLHQISAICDIYSSAESVIVWLGKATSESEIMCWHLDTVMLDLEKMLSEIANGEGKIDFLQNSDAFDPHFWELAGYNPEVYDKEFWSFG